MTTTARKYTPEQVSAMSDAQLSEAVAVHVFGAEPYSAGSPELRFRAYWRREQEHVHIYSPDDSPFGRWVSPNHAACVVRVLEHMRQRWAEAFPDVEYRPRWSLDEEESGEWSASVVSRSCDPEPRPVPCRDCWRLHAEATAASLGRAILRVRPALDTTDAGTPHRYSQ